MLAERNTELKSAHNEVLQLCTELHYDTQTLWLATFLLKQAGFF